MANLNPDVLVWARETAGLTLEQAAKKLQFKDSTASTAAEKLGKYEAGEKQPSKSLIGKMVSVYRRPLITFYLNKIPKKDEGVEDFRTLPEREKTDMDGVVEALIRDIRARQDIVKNVLIEEEEFSDIDLVGAVDPNESIEKTAKKISDFIGFDLKKYRSCKNTKEAFKYLRVLCEKKGIFVILIGNLGSHHTDIPVSMFRGFVIADKVAPLIAINNHDAPPAQSFTLLHELTHLALGDTGISGSWSEIVREKFCNDVASYILLSEKDLEHIEFSGSKLADFCDLIEKVAAKYNVSRPMIAYRLFKVGVIADKETWDTVNQEFTRRWKEEEAIRKRGYQDQDGGPHPYILKRYNLGSLVGLMERMNKSGAITESKAGKVLGVRALKVHKLFDINKSKAIGAA